MNSTELFQALADFKADGGDVDGFLAQAQTLASAAKTPLGLNRWVATDKPTMADFNEDNRIIDEKLRELGEKKAEKGTPQSYSLPVEPGFTTVARYWKNPFNEVTISGQINSSASIPDGSLICTLPEGFRPVQTLGSLPANGGVGNVACRVGIATNGRVVLSVPSGSSVTNLYISVTFLAAN